MTMLNLYCHINGFFNGTDNSWYVVQFTPEIDGFNILYSNTIQIGPINDPLASPIMYVDLPSAADGEAAANKTWMLNSLNTTLGTPGFYDDITLHYMYGSEIFFMHNSIDSAIGALTIDDIAETVSKKWYTLGDKNKLDLIAAGATANDTDANLKDRANHTGTQAASTITGLATVATSGDYADLSGKPTIPSVTRTFSNPTRSLNTAFQVSTTQDSAVSYSVDIACSLSLTGGQAGTVFLRYADDSGHTTNVKEVCRFAASNTGALTIGLSLNQVATGAISGLIPAGKYVKLVTSNDTGTPTFTYRNAQEVLL